MLVFIVFCFLSDDWQGLDGMVIQKNPDENVNHLPSAAICDVDCVNNVNEQTYVNRRYFLFWLIFDHWISYLFIFALR